MPRFPKFEAQSPEISAEKKAKVPLFHQNIGDSNEHANINRYVSIYMYMCTSLVGGHTSDCQHAKFMVRCLGVQLKVARFGSPD